MTDHGQQAHLTTTGRNSLMQPRRTKRWHRTRIATVTVALACAVAVPTSASATATADQTEAPAPYQLTSSTYTVSPLRDSDPIHGQCADGYHVDASYERHISSQPHDSLHSDTSLSWTPQVTVHGDWIKVEHAYGLDRNGTDAKGRPLYRGLSVELYNQSLISKHDGSFTWTCLPN